MKKIILILVLPLTGCYGNLTHGNRMYDSSMLYFKKGDTAIRQAGWLLGTDAKRADSLEALSKQYFKKGDRYADSFDYYMARRFQREVKK